MIRRAVLALGVGIWVLLPVVLILYGEREAADVELAPSTSAWVPVTSNSEPDVTPIGLRLDWSPAPQIVAPEWNGLVEEVTISVGDVLHAGAPVAVMDGVTRLAYPSERPFSRVLESGDRGADVKELNTLLASLDLTHGDGEVYTYLTARGVEDLAEDIGADWTRVFDPNWLVYVPESGIEVAEIDLMVGSPVPPPGTVIASGTASLTAATAVNVDDLDVDGGPDDEAPSADDESASAAGPVSTVEAPDDADIMLGDEVLAIEQESRSGLAREGLDVVERRVEPGTMGIEAVVRRPAGSNEFVIPAAAAFSSDGDRMCALRRRGDEESTVEIVVVGGSTSRTIVQGDLAVGDEVAVSPDQDLRTCG